jgi:signal transduction histidine kinase
MSVHLLLEGAVGELTDAQNDTLQACRQDCERLDKLMRDLLDLSRIEAGESQPRLVPTNPRELIGSAADELRSRVEAEGLVLTVDLASDLPAVLADAAQIERLLNNLIVNAVRNTRHGEIKISAEHQDGHVAVSVRDTGLGIPPEYLPRIFEKFVQAPGAQAGGAGLGLAISRSLVRAHGGHISVKSEVGHGTTFTFTLRLAANSNGTRR